MNQRRTVAAVVVGLLAVGSAACSPNGSGSEASPQPVTKGGVLTVFTPINPVQSGWDPSTADTRIQAVMGPQVMATLLRPDVDTGAPSPWIAESATADTAATTWTVKLRSGVLFSDGAALSARDFAFALTEASRDEQLSTRFGADADGTFFSSAQALDEQTLVVTLRSANALLDRLVFAAPEFGCVKNTYGGLTREQYFAAPLSCGAFVVADAGSASPSTVRLERNPRYVLADEVLPDAVVLGSGGTVRRTADIVLDAPPAGTLVIPQPTPIATSTATATATPTATEPPSDPSTMPPSTTGPDGTAAPTTDPATRVWTDEELITSAPAATTMLVLGAKRPTRDHNLRLALRALPDLTAIAAVSPGAVPATAGLAPVGFNGALTVPVAGGRTDIATTAVSLVPEEARTVIVLVDSTDQVAMERAELLVAQAAAVGITLDLDLQGRTRYDEKVTEGRFSAALVTVAPTVADAVDLARLWWVTDAFGTGWPATIGSEAYTGSLAAPAHGEASVIAAAGFEQEVRSEAYAIPLVSDVHRIGNATGIPGAAVGLVGNIPFERFAPAERQS